ncbi:MAG TPA: 3-phosphoshikimate 1-carboxyvinyltransferase [Chloroflexota bacterium]|jgi:3-phosphoshikimate 1-carboxyvinyltransferase|nr:3-phosphoshikimate 1-carboxyvinyltransferase [Chloroflexota bacterium]
MSVASPPSSTRAVRAAPALHGEVLVPGDKSITHRAVMLNAIASGTATVTGAGLGADCLSTAACMRSLGATVRRRWPDGATGDDLRRHPHSGEEERAGAVLLVEGAGAGSLTEPADVLDAGNSGTTARLLSGVLAGQPFFSVLNGDASLRSRPMGRVVQPLRQMGARIEARREGTLLPLAVSPSSLRGSRLELGVASAQLKSCLLLAGLYARGTTEIVQPEGSRDHTERLLRAQGAQITEGGQRDLTLAVEGGASLRAVDVAVPGDVSSAAFWLVAACIHPDARVTVRDVGINPGRTGLLDVLREMGASITVRNERLSGGEPVADVSAESSALHAVDVGGAMIPRLIDEVPVLAVAAAVASGTTTIRDAAELRVKESDRLAAVAAELGRLGVRVEEQADGLTIHGGRIGAGEVESYGDHRMAMALAVAALAASGPVLIRGGECVDISYPTFWPDLERLAPGSTREL